VDTLRLEPTDDQIAGNFAYLYLALAEARRLQGNVPEMLKAYRRANHFEPNPALEQLLQQVPATSLETRNP
jgi:hypothetical protein